MQVRGADGAPVVFPGVAPVAMQRGAMRRSWSAPGRLGGRSSGPFRYHDKGNLATIGRARAVADIHGLRLGGFIAWATWLASTSGT